MPAQLENRFLSSLSAQSREWLVSRCSPVALPVRTPLYQPQRPLAYGYFLTAGVASVVTPMADGNVAEVGLIGREGLVGALHLLGPAPVTTDCFMQIEGEGLRIRLPDLRQAFQDSAEVRDRVLEFVQADTLEVSQVAGCNRLHEVEERLARWLLTAPDRTESDVILITQEFLAEMLGARRTTVTLVAGALQQSGLIEYQRGRVKIVNRQNLEAAACDCYQVVKRIHAELYSRALPISRREPI